MDNPHRARFERDGYYIAANVLHQDLVDRLNALGDHILAQQDPEHFAQHKTTGSMVLIDWAMTCDHPAMAELVAHPNMLSVLDRLGFDQPKFGHGRIISKPPHSPQLYWCAARTQPAGQFMPVSFLKRVIDGLVLNKMNVLHVHWSDVTSFPIASEKFPQLAEKGKMGRLVRGPLENATVYTKADIRDLVDYARQRGVRIIPEFGASSSPTCPCLRRLD